MSTVSVVSPRHTSRPRIAGLFAALVALAVAAVAAPVPLSPRTAGVVAAATVNAEGTLPTPPVAVDVDPDVAAALTVSTSVDVIVRVASSATADTVALVERHGGEVTAQLPIVDGFAATITRDGFLALMTAPGIHDIALDGSVTLAHDAPPGEEGGDSSFVETIGADQLHTAGLDGAGVGIAIIDTGVSEVPDLAGRVTSGIDLSGDGDGVDRYGHGTFIAGIAAGDGAASSGEHAGVAPGAHVVPVKIAGGDGSADISHVLAAIQWVVSFKDVHDIRVLNLSLGTDSQQPNARSPLNYAVERAWDAGIVVVVSAGNFGELGPGRIPKPADDPLVITVGATDGNGTAEPADDTVAPYSSRGPSIADGIVKPDVVAPGSHLIGPKSPGSTIDVGNPDAHIRDDYLRGSGTSFAAGVVSGAAALLLEAHPDWTPDQVKGALLGTARPGPVGDPNVDGRGILDVAAAAALTAPHPANQGVSRSTGLGSLAADRGSFRTELVLDPALGLTVVLDSTTELTAQDLLFDPAGYTTGEWTNSGWYNSGWYNSGWYNSGWYSSGWYNSGWYNSGWY